MAIQKFLSLAAGRITEVLAIITSAGAGDEGKIPALDASGKLDASFMPAGIGSNTIAVVASEALAANDLVNFWNDTGIIKARKADGTSAGKEAHGFVKSAVASSATATVYTAGNAITGLTGLTPGARQYLSTIPGLRTETPLAASGNIHQLIGIAASDTTIAFDPEEAITRA